MLDRQVHKIDVIDLLGRSPQLAITALYAMHADIVEDYLDLGERPDEKQSLQLVKDRLVIAAGYLGVVIGAVGRALSGTAADESAMRNLAASLAASIDAAADAQAAARAAYRAAFPVAAGRA